MSVESVMPSNHLILCRPLLLPTRFNVDMIPQFSSLSEGHLMGQLTPMSSRTLHLEPCSNPRPIRPTTSFFQFPLASVSCLVLIGDNWQKECDKSDASRVGTVLVGCSFFLY